MLASRKKTTEAGVISGKKNKYGRGCVKAHPLSFTTNLAHLHKPVSPNTQKHRYR